METFAKISLIILGLADCALGIYMFLMGYYINEYIFQLSTFIIPEQFEKTTHSCCILGIFLVFISLFQIVGTHKKWPLLILSAIGFLVYFLLVGIVLIVFLQRDIKLFYSELYPGLRIALIRYYEKSEFGIEFKSGWSLIQRNLKCCGINNYSDWILAINKPNPDPVVPISCCKTYRENCSLNVDLEDFNQAKQFINIQGCFSKAEEHIDLQRLSYGLIPFEVTGSFSLFICIYLAIKWRQRIHWV